MLNSFAFITRGLDTDATASSLPNATTTSTVESTITEKKVATARNVTRLTPAIVQGAIVSFTTVAKLLEVTKNTNCFATVRVLRVYL